VKYWLHPEAEVELDHAAIYYAQYASKKIAAALITEFERVIELISSNQQLGTPGSEGMRTYPLKRFPYLLVYREDSAGPVIYAFAHQHREPNYWRERV
jgi:plasmid stabilization system protein ParE